MDAQEQAQEAAKKAARQAERNRQRAILQNQATRVKRKITEASDLISDFRRQQQELTQLVTSWEQTKNSALSSRIVSEVRVSKQFEGVIAEKQASELPKGIKAMDKNVTQLKNVVDGISDQIQRLSNYQDTQEGILQNIMAQIASI